MKTSLKLHVPEPCHENWNGMTPKEQGRFCASCSKVVVDFSVMTDRQMLEYFSNYSGNTCGRFTNDQLNRVVDPEVRHSKRWWRYMLAAILPAAFFGGKSYSQGKPVPDTTQLQVDTSAVIGDTILMDVVDTSDVVLGELGVVDTSVKGFVAPTLVCDFPDDVILGGLGIEVEIIEEPVFYQFKRFIEDTLRGESFKLYPNPARAGAAINISYKIKKGEYFIQVLDANGRLMQQQAVHLNNDVNSLAFRLGVHYAKGQYMVLLADNKRRKIGARPFIIQ